jgi:hypothetical protein
MVQQLKNLAGPSPLEQLLGGFSGGFQQSFAQRQKAQAQQALQSQQAQAQQELQRQKFREQQQLQQQKGQAASQEQQNLLVALGLVPEQAPESDIGLDGQPVVTPESGVQPDGVLGQAISGGEQVPEEVKEVSLHQQLIDETESISSETPPTDFQDILRKALLSKTAGDIATKEAEIVSRSKEDEAKRHEKESLPFLIEQREGTRKLDEKRLNLAVINDAVASQTTPERFWNFFAQKTGNEDLFTAEGAKLSSGAKGFFFDDLESLKGGRINQFLERTLKSALQSAGKSKEANEIIGAIQQSKIDLAQASINNAERVSNSLFEKHGFVHRSLEPITRATNKQFAKQTEKDLIKTIQEIQARHRKGGDKSAPAQAQQAQPQAQQTFETIPPASAHKGASITDSDTGIVSVSNGKEWIEVK